MSRFERQSPYNLHPSIFLRAVFFVVFGGRYATGRFISHLRYAPGTYFPSVE